MGDRGPQAMPAAVQDLRGNPGHRPVNDAEPKPPTGPPEMPAWLTLVDLNDGLDELNRRQLIARARAAGVPGLSRLTKPALIEAIRATRVSEHEQVWRQLEPLLTQMGVLTSADGITLALLVDVYIEYLQVRTIVRRKGRSYITEGQSGLMHRAHPEVAMLQDAWRRVLVALREVGLTPSARSRMRVEGLEPPADPLDGVLDE